MPHFTSLLLAALMGAGSWFTGCQPEHLPGHMQETSEPVVLQPLRPVAIPAGQVGDVVVEVVVSEGFHVQANPVPFNYLIPTRLEVEANQALEVGGPVYPLGKPYLLQGSPDTLSVYDGTFAITLPVHVSAVARPGHYTLRGTLYYQRCDHRMCFRPTSKPVDIPVNILEAV